MSPVLNAVVIAAVCLLTLLVAVRGLRRTRTTEDVLVAARSVRPWWNASAIGGEYLSAASFLGVTGLIVASGRDALWYPVGYASGFLMLLLFVAAPLRRSGAYTLPDFALVRFGRERVAGVLGLAVLAVGWLYVLPQMHGAALTMHAVTGLPRWVGPALVTAVVIGAVVPGGMRSITLVQALQYWIKLAALAIPAVALVLVVLRRDTGVGDLLSEAGASPALPDPGLGPLVTVSLLLALVFGTLGLPHVLVRFYTNPDGASARTTTVMVTALVCLFYLFPTALGFLAVATGSGGAQPDATVLHLPQALLGGMDGTVLTAVVAGGAFAAFISTSSGLTIAMAGVISRRFFPDSVSGFRRGALIAALVPGLLALVTASEGIASVIGSIFALTASTVAPVLLAGIWWRGATGSGAVAGLVTGAVLWGASAVASLCGLGTALGGLVAQPALVTVPAACLALVLVSNRTRDPGGTARLNEVMRRLHTP